MGAVSVNLASVSMSGLSSNIGFNKSIAMSLFVIGGRVNGTSIPASIKGCIAADCTSYGDGTQTLTKVGAGASKFCGSPGVISTPATQMSRCLLMVSDATSLTIAKGGGYTFIFTLPIIPSGGTNPGKGYVLRSGDTIQIKVTTDVGTFASTSLTVP